MPPLTILLILYAILTSVFSYILYKKAYGPQAQNAETLTKLDYVIALTSELSASCVLTDENGFVQYANKAFLEKCGYTLEELKSFNISKLKASIETDYLAEECWHYLKDDKVWRGPFINQKKSGEVYTEEFIIFPVVENHVRTYCALSYDVANHFLEEKALEQIQKQSMHFKENFISNLSHEVRTPLNALIGLSQLGSKNDHPERHVDYFSKINIASKQLMQLMDDILDFSKIESGSFALVKNRFNFMSLLSAIIDQYAILAAEKSLEFNICVDEFSPQYIYADAFRLEQIFSNLISNAIKFTRAGEVNLSIGMNKSLEEDYEMSIVISDTGEGMSEDHLKGLFNPFSHLVTNNQKRHNKSSGLGMAITKQIVDLMGGSIAILSEPNQGTSITVILPFIGADLELPKLTEHNTIEKLNVLVIDDSEKSRENARKILGGFGYDTTLASSGQEALDLIQSGKRYALIMIDWRMPGLSSENTVIDISKIAENQPRILFMTPFGSSSVEDTVRNLIHGFLPKPYTPSMLFDEIATMFIRSEVGTLEPNNSIGLFHHLTVLLVDDNAVNNTIARNLFESEGAKTISFTKATRALEYLARHKVDFIVSDIDMPEMDGYEFLIALRKANYSYKVSALTANTSDKNRQDILNAGFDIYMSKPLTKEKLKLLHEELQLEIEPKSVPPVEIAPIQDFVTQILSLADAEQLELKRLFQSLNSEANSRRPKACKELLSQLEIYLKDKHLSDSFIRLLSLDLQKYRFDSMIEALETLLKLLGGIIA